MKDEMDDKWTIKHYKAATHARAMYGSDDAVRNARVNPDRSNGTR